MVKRITVVPTEAEAEPETYIILKICIVKTCIHMHKFMSVCICVLLSFINSYKSYRQ